ncbi:MAG: hypothetical protein DI536_07895 [Archangium gephyra]|uniref:Uncharacterized protein n=1 Tax=Archangium gephyra TaxID=48 RepID=A0A2W5TS64_9BACT|nr:MAG: hypothetical protein DI536_07895 [Archangium gephyra]
MNRPVTVAVRLRTPTHIVSQDDGGQRCATERGQPARPLWVKRDGAEPVVEVLERSAEREVGRGAEGAAWLAEERELP